MMGDGDGTRLCPSVPSLSGHGGRFAIRDASKAACVRRDELLGHAFNGFVDAGVRAVDSRAGAGGGEVSIQ